MMPMDVILKVIEGDKPGATIAIKKDEFLIGRSQVRHLCADSSAISRKHCKISRTDNRVTAHDLGSLNGTLINGTNIEGEVELVSGDELSMGPLKFMVTISPGINNGKREKVKSVAKAVQRVAQTPAADASVDDLSQWLLGPSSSALNETQSIRIDDSNVCTWPSHVRKWGEFDDTSMPDGASDLPVKYDRPAQSYHAKAIEWDRQADYSNIIRQLKESHVHVPRINDAGKADLMSVSSKTRIALESEFDIVVVFDCISEIGESKTFELDRFLRFHVRDRLASALGFELDEAYNQEQIAQLLMDAERCDCLFCFVGVEVLSEVDLQRLREFTQSTHRVLFVGPNKWLAAKGESSSEIQTGLRSPGKLPKLPSKPTSKDSREAAVEVLRNLRRRR